MPSETDQMRTDAEREVEAVARAMFPQAFQLEYGTLIALAREKALVAVQTVNTMPAAGGCLLSDLHPSLHPGERCPECGAEA